MFNEQGDNIGALIDSVVFYQNVEIPVNPNDDDDNPIIPVFILEGRDPSNLIRWSERKARYVLVVSVIVSGSQNNVNFVHTESRDRH